MTLPFLITAESELLDLVLKLAAAAGTDVHVSPVVEPEPWRSAPLVLVGEDLLGSVAARGVARRDEVIVVAHRDPFDDESDVPTTVWRDAVAIGASHVVRLPEAQRWLIDQFADSADAPTAGGPVLAVTPACGGAGATTLARALTASVAGALYVDLDPFGVSDDHASPGGLRWPDLAATRGRIPPASLRDALPAMGSARYLGGFSDAVPQEAVATVLEAGARGFPLTVVDTPRALSGPVRAAWARSDVVTLVVGPDERRAVGAEAVVHVARESGNRVVVVPRLSGGPLVGWHLELADLLQTDVLPPMRHDRALARGDAMNGPVPRSIRSTVGALLESVAPRHRIGAA
jgi:secretion/DNA translocation related CpaE-like protein